MSGRTSFGLARAVIAAARAAFGSPRRAQRWSALACALALCVGACGGGAREERPNVLVILVDTLRADRLGAWGGTRSLSPFVDAWASQAQVFRAAYAHAPWTLPSVASLLTSTYPQQHGAGGVVPTRDREGRTHGGFTGLDSTLPTLASLFQDAGYRTGCVVNVDFLGSKFGLTRGFSDVDEMSYADNDHVRDASATTDAALRWLDSRDERPTFLLVHYFDAHAVYDPPRDFRLAHALPQDREDESFRFPTREQMVLLRQGKLPLDRHTIERAEALYDGEVAYVDSQIGRLLDALRARELESGTIIVLTADHGEEFLDHGGFEHGHSLHDELLHVPLAIAWPDRVPAGATDATAGLIDLAPTLCALAGIAPAPTFLGKDLAAAWKGESTPTRTLLAHGNFWGPPLSSLRQGEHKLIRGPRAPDGSRSTELYEWRADPRETQDRAADEAELTSQLGERLDATERALERRRGESVELDASTFESLKDKGYVGGDETDEP